MHVQRIDNDNYEIYLKKPEIARNWESNLSMLLTKSSVSEKKLVNLIILRKKAFSFVNFIAYPSSMFQLVLPGIRAYIRDVKIQNLHIGIFMHVSKAKHWCQNMQNFEEP